MVNLRSKSKAKAVAVKREISVLTPPTALESSNLNEETLRKLPRAQLQKLAMAHKVRANMKSEWIVQQLLNFQLPKKKRSAEDDAEEGPSRKRIRSEGVIEKISTSPQIENRVGPPNNHPALQVSIKDPQPGLSAPQSIPPTHKTPLVLSYDEDLFSGTGSEMTEEEQLDFATPVSSRSGTPPAANVADLDRCVTIMRQISAQDVDLLKEVTDVRDTAAKLHKRARDVRELVRAERGRRERIEAYFRYWQEIEPRWSRKWLYGEKMVPDYKIELHDLDKPAGPPTVPVRRYTERVQDSDSEHNERPVRKPILSLEELRQRREAIVSKQEAEQRQLQDLQRDEGFSGLRPDEATGVDANDPNAS